MAHRKVKCCATGEYGFNDEFYRAPNGRYFKTEETYAEYIQKKETRKALRDEKRNQKAQHEPLRREKSASRRLVMDELMDIFGYVPGQVFPISVPKRLKELEFYGNEIILETIKRCRKDIDFAIADKNFPNEYVKTSYVMAIIKNRINDVYAEQTRKQKANEVEPAPVDHTYMPVDLQSIGTSKRGNDVSSLLGGDDDWI